MHVYRARLIRGLDWRLALYCILLQPLGGRNQGNQQALFVAVRRRSSRVPESIWWRGMGRHTLWCHVLHIASAAWDRSQDNQQALFAAVRHQSSRVAGKYLATRPGATYSLVPPPATKKDGSENNYLNPNYPQVWSYVQYDLAISYVMLYGWS